MERALLQQLREDPCDWDTWLVLRDWHLEQGNEQHAELIRLTHELESRATEPGQQQDELRVALTATHYWTWYKRSNGNLPEFQHLRWRCGYVTEYRADYVLSPEKLAWLARSSLGGLLDTVRIGDWSSRSTVDLPLMLSCDDLRLSRLGIHGCELKTLSGLGRCRNLCSLQHLDLVACDLGLDGVQALVDLDNLESLKALEIRTDDLGQAGAVLGQLRANLRQLTLSSVRLNDNGMRALASSPLVRGLEALHLRSNDIGAPGLAWDGQLSPKSLSLAWNRLIGDVGLDNLVERLDLPQLRYLNLNRCGVTPERLDALRRLPELQECQVVG